MNNKLANGNFKKILNWILKKIFTLLVFSIGIFLFLSFIFYSPTDPYYGFESTDPIINIAGLWGAFISGTFLNYLDITSFLIPAFFIVWGIKILLNIKIRYKVLRILTLIFSTIALSTIYVNFSFFNNTVGYFFNSLFLEKFYENIDNYYIEILFKIISALILIPLALFALTINNKFLINILLIVTKIVKIPIFLLLKFFVSIFRMKKFKNKNQTIKKDPLIHSNTIQEYDAKPKNETAYRKKIKIKDPNQRTLSFDENTDYELPDIGLLKVYDEKNNKFMNENKKNLESKARKLESVLNEFGIQGHIKDVRPGPIVTMFELEPSAGTKASRIINLADDIARSMSALSARISSQPGRNVIGIELPNLKRSPVYLSELLSHEDYLNSNSGLILALGKNISGVPITTDLEKMPHLLIAGTTGSGKSVGLNSMIISLLYKLKPSECRFILIDPKMLELSVYEDIPHLMAPVVTDPHKAIVALKWAVKEMENRYRLMNHASVKNILSYNNKINEFISSGKKMYREVTTGLDPDTRMPMVEKQEIPNETFPYIVIVIDEMADLMMVAGKDVEQAIQRLAQMARAAGIHLIMATQRPSVDVITGTIKANFPSRISYHVASKFDSRTILNEMGAEQLLGSGDMLFMENAGRIKRLHGGFVSESEINNVVRFIKNQSKPDFSEDITSERNLYSNNNDFDENNQVVDELYTKAVEVVISNQKASTSFIQRHMQIGYNRAARIIEQMEKEGIVSEGNHVGKREVLRKNA